MKKALLLTALLTSAFGAFSQDFITRNGNKLTVGVSGPEIYLRGICMGNRVWDNDTLPTDTHQEIDFERVRNMGMNAMRFYMNYLTFENDAQPFVYKPQGWAWIDTNIVWAKKNGIYLILNIHVPQGGYQSNCGGSALWQVSSNQDRLVALWKAIAQRYANEPQIAGFDFLNEPNPIDSLGQWRVLEQRIIDSIRKVDNNHLVFSEKIIALNCNYGYDNGKGNFNILKEDKLVYSIHTYDPYQYTTQLQSWAGTGDGGKYPDETAVTVPSDLVYNVGQYNNPALPAGTSGWQYYQGVPYTVAADSLIIAKPVLHANSINGGTAYFNRITLNEVDASGNVVQQILTDSNFANLSNLYYYSANNDGSMSLANTGPPNESTSISVTGASSYSSVTNYGLPFRVYKGKRYVISGWMKGTNIPSGASVSITMEFYNSPSKQPVYARDIQYLRSQLLYYTQYPVQNNFPIYYGEFGADRPCFENGKGGATWVSDMIHLFDSLHIHWTYHDYREDGFGLYAGVSGAVDTTTVNLSLQQTFESYFQSLPTGLTNNAIAENATFKVYPNPSSGSFWIENKTSSTAQVQLSDASGKIVYSQTLSANQVSELGVKNLNQGLYYCIIQQGDQRSTQKLVKE